MGWIRCHYPFNGVQTVNILGEFGPLMAMFVVNALYNVTAGTWALIVGTAIAMAAMILVVGRLPIFPFIAGSATLTFSTLTLLTDDPMWVQVKVTIFNVLFAIFLWIGLAFKKNFFKYVFAKTFHYTDRGWNAFANNFAWFFVFTAIANEIVRLTSDIQIWILFKVLFVMPISGLFAWWQIRLMQRYRLRKRLPVLAGGLVPLQD
ncbi:MAG: inner membrane-spanning protein YciB [Hyphomicrobiaceae bacterium]